MKKGKMIWLAVLAALVLVPTMGWAAPATPTTSMAATEPSFFAELYVGGGAAQTSQNFFGAAGVDVSGDYNPFVLGGVKLGYWFTPYGTYAAAWYPDWMKYLGFYTDFSYHRLTSNTNGVTQAGVWVDTIKANGGLATWAFMFAGRYGFLPDSQVPFGRLQPYIAVGPAVFFSTQRYSFTVGNTGYLDSTDVGLAAETGIRYFFNKSVSVEASFKYRWFKPKYNFDNATGMKPDFNLFSGQVGAAYHF